MFKKILVPTELSAASNSVFPWAATLAQGFNSKLYLVNVMPPAAIDGPEILEDFPHLNEFFPQDRELGFNPPLAPEVPVSKMFVYDRNEANILLRFANEKEVDLIALAATSKRIELTWWSAGQTVEKIIRNAPCSVFCVRGKRLSEGDWKRPHFRHILLLTSLEGQLPSLLERVTPLVDRFQSVLHIFPLHSERLKSSGEREALRQLCQIQGASPNVLFFSEPKNRMQNLLNFLRETPVELIVMTPDTRASFSNRLVSDIFVQLLRLARCPVLLLR